MQNVTNFLSSHIKALLVHPIFTRAGHTFLQAFLAVWLVNGFNLDKLTLTAAVAAGISALKTLVVESYKARS
jgi:hypothetical protein